MILSVFENLSWPPAVPFKLSRSFYFHIVQQFETNSGFIWLDSFHFSNFLKNLKDGERELNTNEEGSIVESVEWME